MFEYLAFHHQKELDFLHEGHEFEDLQLVEVFHVPEILYLRNQFLWDFVKLLLEIRICQ